MRKKYLHIASFILIWLLFVGFSGPARADQSPDAIEMELLGLINQARINPLAMAAILGLDPNQVLNDLPELAEILTQRLAPLTPNGQLAGAALDHTRDMLDKNYYSSDSPDGTTVTDRIRSAGYPATSCGETLGMLGFINFIKPGQAVWHIFENMFLDELNPQRTQKRNILNGEFDDIGISVGSGVFNSGGNYFNVYLATCDFAAGTVSVLEMELLELINQAREKPLEMAASMGMNPDDIIAALPELAEILSQGLAPLTFNRTLCSSARSHAVDMMTNSYYSITSTDGREVEDRVMENGYDPVQAGEAIYMLVTEGENDPWETAKILFEKIFRHELSPLCLSRNILNPVFKEVGVNFKTLPAGESLEQDRWYSEYNISMMVCDFGLSAADIGLPYLKGRVYTDWDGNGIYSPGEGVDGTGLQIQGPETVVNVYTNLAGGFVAQLETGVTYRIIPLTDDAVEERQIEMGAENRSMDFIIEPEIQPEDEAE